MSERLVYGTRINGRWCFVVNSEAALRLCDGDITSMDAECRCGENAMRLDRRRQRDGSRLDSMVCCGCAERYPIAQMPARQCVDGSWQEATEYLPPAWAVDLDERDANARYGIGE